MVVINLNRGDVERILLLNRIPRAKVDKAMSSLEGDGIAKFTYEVIKWTVVRECGVYHVITR